MLVSDFHQFLQLAVIQCGKVERADHTCGQCIDEASGQTASFSPLLTFSPSLELQWDFQDFLSSLHDG